MTIPEYKIVTNQEELLKAYLVRGIVFIEEQNCPYEIEFDEYDYDSSIHILGQYNQEPIAAGRIRLIDKYAKLERLAVRKNFRGKGFGLDLLKYMMDVSIKKGVSSIKIHAQVRLRDFYKKVGFQEFGDEFIEANIRHIAMEYKVK
jgi:predicted GNAT family N-acyltransferase